MDVGELHELHRLVGMLDCRVQIIALGDDALAKRLDEKRANDAAAVLKKDAAICAEFQ